MTVRMVLAHPRSRSNLLCASYDDYTSELFSPVYISTTEFFKEHQHLLEHDRGAFSTSYLDHLRATYKGKSFTFKVHHCSINWWTEAQALIAEWAPSEVIEVYRRDREMAVYSYLLARHFGYVHQLGKVRKPFTVSEFEAKTAIADIKARWDHPYKVDRIVEFNRVDRDIQTTNGWTMSQLDNFYRTKAPTPQDSFRSTNLILNLTEVRGWIFNDPDLFALPPNHADR